MIDGIPYVGFSLHLNSKEEIFKEISWGNYVSRVMWKQKSIGVLPSLGGLKNETGRLIILTVE